MDYSKYKKMFIDETMENLTNINDTLAVVEQDSASEDAIQKLFRFFHSIKGMAASMNYRQIQEVSHKLEDLLDGLRNGRIEFKVEILNILYDGTSMLEKLVRIIEEDSKESVETDKFLERLVKMCTVSPPSPAGPAPEIPEKKETEDELSQNDLAELDKVSKNQYKILITIAKECISPPARALLLLEEIKGTAEIVKTIPSLNEINEGSMDMAFTIFLATEEPRSKLESIISSSVEIDNFSIEKIDVTEEERSGEPKKLLTRSPGSDDKNKALGYRKPHAVKVDTPVLDSFIDIVGEMFIQENQLRDKVRSLKSPETVESINQLEKLVRKFYKEVMTLRLVPISLLTDMIPRIMREALRDSEKKVDLVINGKDIKLDRSIIEKLGNPLIHLIRNSIDHGIESPEERAKAEKPEIAKLTFTAIKESDSISIQLSDDGRGLNAEKIKDKVIKNKLSTAEALQNTDEADIYNFIWLPGFSTADQVTSVSGRGVGMDIVKSTVEGLGGKISVTSSVGQGCSFRLQVPLTVAIIKTLRIMLEKDVFAIPVTKILHTVEIPVKELKDNNGVLHFYYRDEKIPVYDLKLLLKFNRNGYQEKNIVRVLIVDAGLDGNTKSGLIVDSIISINETVVKSIGKPLEKIEVYSGTTMSEKGEIILILDVDKIFLQRG